MSPGLSPAFRLVFLAVAWVAWLLPFFLFRPKDRPKAAQVAPRARWGIVLQALGFWLTYAHTPATWGTAFDSHRFVLAALLATLGIVLAWKAIRSLGRQWRVDAGLNPDHELVQTGPYKIVRHPIYASMLCMLLMGIAAIGTLPMWPIALALSVAGIEIRVRTEDGLLRGRFGDQFEAWRGKVPAYIPFVR